MAKKTINILNKSSHRGAAAKIRKLKLKYPELSNAEIGRTVGCTEGNVRSVLRQFLRDATESDLRDYQANKADVFDALGLQLLQSLTPSKLEKASALQAVTAAAILQDKTQVLRGQATSINVTVLMDVVEAIRARRDGRDG